MVVSKRITNRPEDIAELASALVVHHVVRVEIAGLYVDFAYGVKELGRSRPADRSLLVLVPCFKGQTYGGPHFNWRSFFEEERDRKEGE